MAAYKLKDRRLAGSVLADKTDLVTLADMEIYIIQQGEATIGYGETVDRYHIRYKLFSMIEERDFGHRTGRRVTASMNPRVTAPSQSRTSS